MTDPTLGRPGGEHRVLEPPDGTPLTATRLDAFSELWDGELRLALQAVVLTIDGHARLVERVGPDRQALAAAFTEAVAERGGVGPEAHDAVLIGTVATVGTRRRYAASVGERVAVLAPAGAVPLFAAPDQDHDGGRHVPVRGHAIVGGAQPTLRLDDESPTLAAELARVADVPVGLGRGSAVVVLGAETSVGAVAVAAAAAQGRHVTAVSATLHGARVARHLGASVATVADLGDPVATADLLESGHGPRVELAIVATPAATALAARLAPTVQVLTDPVAHATVGAEVTVQAAALGHGITVQLGRPTVTDHGATLRELLGSNRLLADVLRWQAGLAAAPAPADPDDPDDASETEGT